VAIRNFNIDEQFKATKASAVEAIQTIFPITGKIRTMRLDKVWVEDKLGAKDFSSQLKSKEGDGTWGVPVYAALSLVDKASGEVIDKTPKIRLFNLPKLTDRFSYIVKGNEYQVQNQLRLKPGVFTLRKQNQDLKTQINLAKGKNFDLSFKESTGVFYIQNVGGGKADIPLYPILIYLGVSPSLIAKTWGQKLEAANRNTDPKAVSRASSAFGLRATSLKDYLSTTEISKETTKTTLGQSFSKVDGPMLLASSKNLLDVHLGKEEPIDRDSLEFKDLWSVEDFIKERLEKNKGTLANKISRQIDNPKRTKISQIVNPGAFSSVIETFFTTDDKVSTPEQTNPLEMVSEQYKTTIMGSGGIKSEHAITPEMREVHPSTYGFLDPLHTPESKKIGADSHLPLGAIKDGKDLKKIVIDKKGKPAAITPSEAKNKYIALPGEKGEKIKAMYREKVVVVPKSKIDYYTPTPQTIFSGSTNLVPYLSSIQGNRTMMAAKMMEQAISLKNRENPLVQVESNTGESFEKNIGESIAVKAPEEGTVVSVSPEKITIKTKSGKKLTENLYKDFTLNRKSYLNHEPVVKVGDTVRKGQLIADSNFTKGGTLALGTNLRAAYLPYKGLNFEDGIVITDAAAEKLTSQHIHKKHLDIDENVKTGLNVFKAMYPNALTPENIGKLDESGVIKVGKKVKHGEFVIVALRKRDASRSVGVVHKALADRPKDISVQWTLEDDGVISKVKKTSKKIMVYIKTEEKAKIGDKLAGRMGNKGIITKIINEDEAPKNKNGEPVDILLNPAGVIGRININQIYESAVGKAAKKRGKPYIIKNFGEKDNLVAVKKIMKEAGVDDKEELFDPKSNKSLGRVHVGNPHILKLYKQGTANFSVRQGGAGTPYDANLQPVKSGGEEGAKNLDVLTLYAMLSHGARANLREMSSVKSSQNDEFWKALKSGQQLPPPETPFAYEKFMNYLKASGINVEKNGTKRILTPLTDKDVAKMSSGEVKRPRFYRAKDMEPEKGGFFDPVKFGGFRGMKWGHMDLKEPVVNPVFEGAVKKITGLGKKYNEIMAGKLFVAEDGTFNKEGKGVTSGTAIEKILKGINVDQEIETLTEKAKKAKKTSLDNINKRLRYLTALKKAGLKPEEAYIRKKMPVIPPMFRPLYPLPDGNVTSSDINYLYQNAAIINEMKKLPVMDLMAEDKKADLRKDAYESMKAVSGFSDLPIKGKEREGFISEIKGGASGQPKEGFFISKLMSKKQDYVGRGTIIPDPDLGVDEVGMPEEMAWKIFEPFLIKELKNQGKTPLKAKEEIKEKTLLARKALEMVMKDRKVLLNRAPSLHKFSIMAFNPKITTGRSIKIPPLVVSGFNADFDGDTMMLHTPISDEANQEAEGMTPSRNLFQAGTGKLMIAPGHEAQVGLFYLSKTAKGRTKLNQILAGHEKVDFVLNKKQTKDMLNKLAKGLKPGVYGKIVAELKKAGEDEAFNRGFTLGLDDIVTLSKDRDKVIDAAKRIAKTAKAEELSGLNNKMSKLIDKLIDKKLKNTNNPLYDMVDSGGRGNMSNLRSLVASPLFVADAKGRVIPSPISKSYAEGLDIGDYWTSTYGARHGMIDRAIQTSLPGAFSKDIMATTIDNVISGEDCGTKKGVDLPISSKDVLDRYLAGAHGGFAHNTLVDQSVVSKLRKEGVKTLRVRSPLTCLRPRGTCSYCYGLDEHGELPSIGDNVGAKSGQVISEPLVQMVMNTFHTGGVAGTGQDPEGYQRIDQLLQISDMKNAAPLAPKKGKITKISPGLAGGFYVEVEGEKVFVPKGRPLKVKVGQMVEAGDALALGAIKPQDLVKHKGMLPAQQYITSELQKAYSNQGANISRKTFETIVRSLGNTTQVLNNPKDSDYLPGDVIPYTVAQHHNENLVETVKAENAIGRTLNKRYGPFDRGRVIDNKALKMLKVLGHNEVEVKKDPIKHAPFLKGMRAMPLLKRDWMAALGYQNLSKVLVEGASQGWKTDLSSHHPIPAFAQGTTFGKGKGGRY